MRLLFLWRLEMPLIRVAVACASLFALNALVPSAARADAWGCSYDKCVAYCTKVSGKFCTTYCDRRLKEKRNEKICK